MTPPSVETLQPPTHIIERAVYESTCSPCRSKRGAVVYAGADFIAAAHNWKPQPFTCDGSATCKATCRVEAVHAEQAALIYAGSNAFRAEMLHVKTVDGALVPSGGPSCVQCSKLILAAGIEAMWLYQNDGWHRYEAAEFHRLSLAETLTQQQARIAELEQQHEATRKELEAERDAWKAEAKLMIHKVITCGVAATHSNRNLTRERKCYADTWNSPQAEAVRQLRDRAEQAEAALTALRAQHAQVTKEVNGWREVGEEMGRIVSFMSPEQKDDLLPDWFGPRLFDMQVKAASSSCEASEKGT